MSDISHLQGTINKLIEVKAEIADLEIMKKQLEETIKEAIGDDEIGTIDDKKVATYTKYVARVFDTASFKERERATYDRYCKDSERTRFALIIEDENQ